MMNIKHEDIFSGRYFFPLCVLISFYILKIDLIYVMKSFTLRLRNMDFRTHYRGEDDFVATFKLVRTVM